MAPKTATPAAPTNSKLNYALAKKVCTQSDLDRLLCAFLNSEEAIKFDAEAAATQLGTGVKPQSFKRMYRDTIKKIREAMEKGETGESNDGDATVDNNATPKGKGKGGRKRKSPAAADDEEGATATPTPKKKKGGKGAKKGSAETEGGDGGEGEGEDSGWNAVNGNGNGIKAEEMDDDA